MQYQQDDISERIAAARRDADLLKERIKQRKEALADTTCKCLFRCNPTLSKEKIFSLTKKSTSTKNGRKGGTFTSTCNESTS